MTPPTSTKPMPVLWTPAIATAFLSNPAEMATGLPKVIPIRDCTSAGWSFDAACGPSPADRLRSAKPCAVSAGRQRKAAVANLWSVLKTLRI